MDYLRQGGAPSEFDGLASTFFRLLAPSKGRTSPNDRYRMNPSTWLLELKSERQAGERDDIHGRILDAASELFLTFGIRRTTIDNIAKQSGIGRPTLYRRFRDKDAIVLALFLRESRRLIADVSREVASLRTPEEKLVRAFVVASRTVAMNPLSRRLLDTEPEVVLPYLTVKAGPLIDVGHLILGAGAKAEQRDGHFEGVDLDLLLETYARLFISVIVTRSSRLDAWDEATLERYATAFLMPQAAPRRARPAPS